MKYYKFNSINLKISAIGFGGWQLGGELVLAGNPNSYGKIDEQEARKAIHLAFDKGINFFDTADIYGLGKSERILGEELKEKRDKVILCSKVGYIPDGVKGTITDFSYEHIMASCNRSLKRLQTDYLDIYLLHSIPDIKQIKESQNALENLQKQGKIKTYGISLAHRLDMIPEFADTFQIIEGYYNLLMRDVEGFKDILVKNNNLFIAASPLSRGLLSGKNYEDTSFEKGDIRSKWKKGQSQHSWYLEKKQTVSRLEDISKKWEIPLRAMAIDYLLDSKNTILIPGMKSQNQVQEIIDALEFYPLEDNKINILKKL